MDLTEVGASRVSKMVSGESKDQLIMASNGSLASAGNKLLLFCFIKAFELKVLAYWFIRYSELKLKTGLFGITFICM